MSKLRLMTIILILFSFILLSGCANTAVSVWDGVIRNEDGTSLTNTFDDTLSVQDKDKTFQTFSYFLTMPLSSTALIDDASVGDESITVNDVTNCTDFDAINIYDDEYYFQSLIYNVTGSTINLNSELDKNFSSTNTIVECAEWDLSTTDGSLIDNKIFSVSPPQNVTWHIISTNINIIDDKEMDDSKFGGIPMLDNGISGRVIDGYKKDLFLIYNNNGFFLRGFNKNYVAKAPAGLYSFNARLIFKEQYGSVVYLNGEDNDEWQAVNRDDLTSLEEVAITVQGHYYLE